MLLRDVLNIRMNEVLKQNKKGTMECFYRKSNGQKTIEISFGSFFYKEVSKLMGYGKSLRQIFLNTGFY